MPLLNVAVSTHPAGFAMLSWRCIQSRACVRCRCSTKSQCVDADADSRWLSYDAWECIRVPPQFVNPAVIAVTSTVQVRGFWHAALHATLKHSRSAAKFLAARRHVVA